MNNKKIFIIVTIAGIICFIIFAFRMTQQTKYAKINATIESYEIDNTDRTGNATTLPTYYVIYSYNYNGKEYTSKQQVFSLAGIEVGKTKNIRINPNNPKNIFEPYKSLGILFVSIFCFVWNILLLIVKKKEQSSAKIQT